MRIQSLFFVSLAVIHTVSAFCSFRSPCSLVTKTKRCEFATPRTSLQAQQAHQADLQQESSRRRQLFGLLLPAALLLPVLPVNAVVVENTSENVFVAGQPLGVDQAKERFKMAQASLSELTNDYASISSLGGDNVRRYLGTVGTTSGLFGIQKVLKALQEEAGDIVEYTENMNEFAAVLNGADTACYSSNFVKFSSAKGSPEQYLGYAERDIKQMQVHLSAMAAEINNL
jgi:hypothetical protein